MKKIFKKIKEHWDLKDPWQIPVILFVFSISGLSVLYIRRLSFHWLGFSSHTALWKEAVAWVSIVVPSYQLILLIFGALFGKFDFFLRFEKNNLLRLKKMGEKNSLILLTRNKAKNKI